ncbi:MAG: transcription termination/antitermination protein NusA [Lachnospiraceae bacterium]|nr:transcription termination/antitermination protein NusA [Lachnospiraceae bacterium]
MNSDLLLALDQIEKEKNISKEILIEAMENSLVAACKNHFGKADNISVNINRETGEVGVFAAKEVVEEVTDPVMEISVEQAAKDFPDAQLGDIVQVVVTPKNFGRIAAQKAKGVVVQKIREEERKVLYHQYSALEREVITGIVQRYVGANVAVNLGKCDAILTEKEQVKGEVFRPTERIKVYVLEVKDTPKGPRISVSRTHPDLVKRLFEAEVTEVRDGTVEIMGISREAGSRTKMAVWSSNPDVDPVGACVGVNGSRVNAIVDELRGEKIDIINWSDDPATLIENALSPAKVVSVTISRDPLEKAAQVIVPDYQLSLAIGKEGQNARLAARLTGYKIDIKSQSQAGMLYTRTGDEPTRRTGRVHYDDEDLYYDNDHYTEEYSEDEYYEEGEYTDEYYEDEYYEDGEYYEDENGEYYEDEYYEDGEYADPEDGEEK